MVGAAGGGREDAPGRRPQRPSGGPAVPDRLSSGMCVSARRGGMIQTAEQYQFLHHTLALFAAQLPEEPSP